MKTCCPGDYLYVRVTFVIDIQTFMMISDLAPVPFTPMCLCLQTTQVPARIWEWRSVTKLTLWRCAHIIPCQPLSVAKAHEASLVHVHTFLLHTYWQLLPLPPPPRVRPPTISHHLSTSNTKCTFLIQPQHDVCVRWSTIKTEDLTQVGIGGEMVIGSSAGHQQFSRRENADTHIINFLEYPIPPATPPAPRHKKPGWPYFGNEKSYRRPAGVKTTGFLRAFQISWWARRTKSGPKGPQLEVGVWRAPILLVINIIKHETTSTTT